MSLIEGSIVGVLAIAVLTGGWRVWGSTQPWRWTRVFGQVFMAVLLYLLIFPPSINRPRETGIILSPGTTPHQISGLSQELPTLALPGLETSKPTIEQIPDLATGLRQHPEIGDLHVLGDGLPARDREAVGDRGLAFAPGDDPQGIVQLSVPDFVREGGRWSVRGRVAGEGNQQLRLLDRIDEPVATTATDNEGRFELALQAKAAGQTLYRLQLLDDQETLMEEIPLPMVVVAGDSLRVLILAGGPDADLKYLRRWILDSGNTVASRISLSRGIEQNQDGTALDAKSLAETDILIIDERAWAGLSGSAKSLIRAAVGQGLGMLLRVTAPMSAATTSEWKVFGFDIKPADIGRSVALAAPFSDLVLTRPALVLVAADSVPFVRAGDGSLLAAWRAIEQGRVGVWLPLDSYRLELSGDSTRYGSLWSGIFASVARARGESIPVVPKRLPVGERSVFCNLSSDSSIEDADGQRHDLLIDAGSNSCAAWWPVQTGWHRLNNAESSWPLYVHAANVAKSLARTELRQATARMQKSAPDQTTYRAAMPRWPLLLAWLLVCSVFWWLERRLSR